LIPRKKKISATALKEISKLENFIKKQNIRDLIFDYSVKILELSEESVKLAEEYIRKGAIPKSEPEDGLMKIAIYFS
jgi:hypothetical protein